MALAEGTTTRPVRRKKRRAASAPQGEHASTRRAATPTVTEHTRGQAGPVPGQHERIRAQYLRDLAMLHGSANRAAGHGWSATHNPLATAARTADLLLRTAGQSDRAQLPGRVNEGSVANEQLLRILAQGLQEDFRHPLRHPLSTGLDVASLASGVVGGLARVSAAAKAAQAASEGEKGAAALRALSTRPLPSEALPARLLPDESGVRKVRLGGGHIQPRESPNLITAAAQHAIDRFSEARPNAPVVGAASRIERRIGKERNVAHTRETSAGIPFAVAHKAVASRKPGKVNAREVAANRLIDYGHQDPTAAAKLVEQEIEFRHKRLALPDITPAERKAQTRLIKQLQAALPHVANPDVEVQALAREGAKLSGKSGALAVAAGELKPETAAARLDLHPRLVHGAQYVEPTAARMGQETRAVKNARVKVTSLQRRFQASIEKNGRSSPTTTRIGGALSVWKDKLQTAEKAAASRVQPAGLVGAENVTAGPGAARVPDVAAQPRMSTLQRRKSNVTGKQQRLVQQSRGVLFTQGRARADTRVILEDYLRSARHQTQAEDIRIAGKFSVPLDKNVGIPEGHVIYNPQGLKVPRALREDPQQLAPETMTPRELSEHLINERRKTFARVFPTSEAELPTGEKALRTIDKRIADAIAGDLSMPTSGAARALGRVFDTTNNLNKAALIYLKGSYVPLNLAGNIAFLGLHQGPFLLKNLKRASVRMSDLDPELLRRIDHEVGGGAALALAHDIKGGVGGGALQKIADIEGAAADTLPRRAAWIHEAAAHGFKTPDQIRSLLTMGDHSPTLNQVSESARRAMVDFGNLSNFERKFVSRAIFIYPWMKGATIYAKDLALDRPIAADFAEHIRQRIHDYQKKHLGRIDPNLTGLIPLNWLPPVLGGGGPVKKLGTTVQSVMNPTSLTPIGTASEVAGAVKGFATGNAEQRALPAGFLTPTLNALVEAATHYNTFTGHAYPKSTPGWEIAQQDITGTVDRPTIPIASIAKTALSKPQTEPFTGPASKQRSYVGEGGLGAAARQFWLGSARPRELNLPAAQARGRQAELASMSPTRRAVAKTTDQYDKALTTLREKGKYQRRQWEPVYASAIQRIARRNAEYAKAGVKNQYDRLLVDLDLAVRRGVLTKQMAAADTAAFKSAKDKDIENYRAKIHTQDAFGESAASEVRQAYRDAGGTWPPR